MRLPTVFKTLLVLTVAVVGIASHSAAFGASITIDLEHSPGPDGILGTADDVPTPSACGWLCASLGSLGYSAVGVNFTSGELAAGLFFPGSLSTNHFSTSSVPDATFSIPVFGVSVDSYSYWSLTLYGLDSADNVVASSTFTSPTDGSGFQLPTLSISSSTALARFTVRPVGCSISEACSHIVNIDNFVLSTSADTSGVPEPGTIGLMTLGGAFLLFAMRRKQKDHLATRKDR